MFLRKFTTSSTRQAIIYSKEVHQALQSHSPVVALESTIISHGMPYPQNLETALQVEDDVRANGAVPATIALMDGDLCIGLEQIQLERLARDGLSATKCSRRDLARVLSQKDLGATTVSGTMIASKLAGIDVFVTGGIGGVHRGVEDTMDVSADLTELARTPVVVVCAGVKSILDIPRTLEYLETQGVAVMCWQTDRFPAFFTVDSGEKAPIRIDQATEVAEWIEANKALRLQSGAIVAVPNPEPADPTVLNNALDVALKEVKEKKVQGKEATPYLLKRVNELTGGDSLRSNIALVRNNARIGAQIAVANSQQQLMQQSQSPRRSFSTSAFTSTSTSTPSTPISLSRYPPLVIGGATVDMIARADLDLDFQPGTSNLGTVQQTHGGVARNITECLGRFGTRPIFASVAGEDDAGNAITNALQELDVNVSNVVRVDQGRTAVYNALLDDNGDLIAAVADMAIMDHMHVGFASNVLDHVSSLSKSKLMVMDGNVSSAAMVTLSQGLGQKDVSVWYEPTSVVKSTRVLDALGHVALMSPNLDELISIADALGISHEIDNRDNIKNEEIEDIGAVERLGMAVAQKMLQTTIAMFPASAYNPLGTDVTKWVLVTMGEKGCVLCTSKSVGNDHAAKNDITTSSVHLTSPIVENMENCTGAGDCLLATMAAVYVESGDSFNMENAVQIGMDAARLTIQSTKPVSELLTKEWLNGKIQQR